MRHRNRSKWNVAIYVRLSNEDINSVGISESVKNQRDIIEEHIERLDDGDIYNIVKEYVDDGISGTTARERTGFQMMLRDIQKGFINCVVVKDLSRSFRNYSDQGYYLDEWFPKHQVRFISLSRQPIDTYREAFHERNIMVPIQGILNENYSAELSAKIRSVMDMKRRKGEYVGTFAPYGYVTEPNNKSKLRIDPEAAEVVKEIFRSFLSGTTRTSIARQLNEKGIPCPFLYKKEVLRLNITPMSRKERKLPLWTTTMITRILKNQMYCGDMVQGCTRRKSYKIHVQEPVPEEEWIVVENTHEAIIDRETFEETQILLQTKIQPKKRTGIRCDLFAGLLRCSDCGKAMIPCGKWHYGCITYEHQSKSACSRHYIRRDQLEKAVLEAIKQQIYLAVRYEKVLQEYIKPKMEETKKQLDVLCKQKENEIEQVSKYKRGIYQDWKDGILTRQAYMELKDDYDEQLKLSKKQREETLSEFQKQESRFSDENEFINIFKKYETITELSSELLKTLIEKIEIYEDENIKIFFRCSDELMKAKNAVMEFEYDKNCFLQYEQGAYRKIP